MGSGTLGVVGGSSAKHLGGVYAGIGVAGFIASLLINRNRYLDRNDIRKLEEAIKSIEDHSFEKAKVMWEKQISEHRTELDVLKHKGNKESRELIAIYDKCVFEIIEKEKEVAYYQERVGDLG